MNVLVTGARAPIAADIARALALGGHRVWSTDSLRAPVGGVSRFIHGFVRLPPPRTEFRAFVAGLVAACRTLSIDAIVPTSEEVFWLAGAAPFLPPSVNLRTSPLAVLAPLHHKGEFARLAAALGHGVPETREVTSSAQLAELRDPRSHVLKPIYSRFATRTLIGPSPAALARVRPTPDEPWLVQRRVIGREICAYNVAESGQLLLHVAYEPLFRAGLGASVYFSPVASETIHRFSERVIAATGFTGQISFDAIETDDGLVALECNPRGTSGVHLAAQQPGVFAEALLGRTAGTDRSPLAAPRMLLLPLLLKHPGLLAQAHGRSRLRASRDSLALAGVPAWRQLLALAELGWRATRAGSSISRVSTADIEWNGEPIRG